MDNPWKRLEEMKIGASGKSNKSSPMHEVKLSAYERQLIEDMNTPKGRLTTISENLENKSKLKGFKSNKLAPYDDKSDTEISKSKNNATWALVDTRKLRN